MLSLPRRGVRFLITKHIQSKGYFPVSEICSADGAEILLLAFNAFSLHEVTPARNHFVDCLGINSLLPLLLHYVNREFQMGVLLFHSFTDLFYNLSMFLRDLFPIGFDFQTLI